MVSPKVLLRPGDCLLYKPAGVFGRLIALKTWHHISHVEVYDGEGLSWASRDGIGVGHYALRLSQLQYILRPIPPLDLAAARRFATRMIGTPYGWFDLLQFFGAPVNCSGIVCSPFVAGFYRAGGISFFPTDPVERIAPFQFLDLIGAGMTKVYDAGEVR
jgi:hypothetical protein